MKDQNFSNLTGKILIASPFAMEGNVFHKSLIYVIKHTDEGSIGLIINRPVNNSPVKNIFGKIKGMDIQNINLDIHIGGPVEIERGFFLHSADYSKNLLYNILLSYMSSNKFSYIYYITTALLWKMHNITT